MDKNVIFRLFCFSAFLVYDGLRLMSLMINMFFCVKVFFQSHLCIKLLYHLTKINIPSMNNIDAFRFDNSSGQSAMLLLAQENC